MSILNLKLWYKIKKQTVHKWLLKLWYTCKNAFEKPNARFEAPHSGSSGCVTARLESALSEAHVVTSQAHVVTQGQCVVVVTPGWRVGVAAEERRGHA